MTTVFPQCMFCTRYREDAPGTCDAYPERIPDEILRNEWDHRQPQPGDHGLQFVPRPGERHPMDDERRA